MFAIAYDVVSDFGDAIGLVFDKDFEEGLLVGLGVGFGIDVLADSITLDFRWVGIWAKGLGHGDVG